MVDWGLFSKNQSSKNEAWNEVIDAMFSNDFLEDQDA